MFKSVKRIIQAFVVLLSVIHLHVQADKLIVGFGEGKPPFVYSVDDRWHGFEIDLVRSILHNKGHQVIEAVYLPHKRLDTAIKKMKLDMAVSVKPKDDGLFYSSDIIVFKNYAISLKEDNLQINSVKDLAKYNVASWYGASTAMGEAYKETFSKQAIAKRQGGYEEYPNQNVQNVVFWYKRAQVIVIDKTIFLWNKKELKDQYNTNVELVYHDIFPVKNAYQAAFKSKQIRDDFDQGLKEFKASGKYQALMDKYTL